MNLSNASYKWYNKFTAFCILFRIFNGGWMLFSALIILLPYYIVHWMGQMKAYEGKNLTTKDIIFINSSTVLFFLSNITQPEEDEHKSFYIFERYIGKQLPPPDSLFDWHFLAYFGWIFVLDISINIYFLIRFKNIKLYT